MITSDQYGGDAAMSQDEGRERFLREELRLAYLQGFDDGKGRPEDAEPREPRYDNAGAILGTLDRLRTPTAEPSEPVAWAAYFPDDGHESPEGGILLEGMTGGQLLAYDSREVAEKATGYALPLYAHPVPEDPESAVDQ